MLYIIRFWIFVLLMTLLTWGIARLLGHAFSLIRVFVFWLGVTLLSILALYLFSMLVSGF